MAERLLIRAGTLYNGAPHAQAIQGDVLIEGDRILRIGKALRVPDARTLDAAGAIVAPGFIDVHSHSDITALQDPSSGGRVHDGVTTELNGTCGYSVFPLTGCDATERREGFRREGIEADWTTAAEYFDRLAATGTAINRGYFAGHGAVRRCVMGFADRAPTRAELHRMETLAAEAMEQGAFGLSSGLAYPPGCFAKSAELVALCRVAARFGGSYVTHMRSEGRALIASLKETFSIARRSGASLQISHLKVNGRSHWWKFERMRELIAEAREEGIEFYADRYPYTACQTSIASLFPDAFMEGGAKHALERLRSPAQRQRLRRALLQRHRRRDRWDTILLCYAEGDAREFEGLTLRQASERLALDPPDAIMEILRRSKLNASGIFFDMSEEDLEKILRWPFVFVGSDSSARALRGPTAQGKPHPRTFGSFARYLSEYVLKRKLLPLAEGIARITSLPARRFGLRERGELRPGAFADLVVFDPKRLRDRATYQDPFQYSEGMRHVVVNGRPVLLNGRRTSARPGRVLRR